MELELYKLEVKSGMQKAIEKYEDNLHKVSTGRANPKILEHLNVDYFDSMTPINQLASISVPEYNQLLIKPFDPITVKNIVAVINSASLGFQAVDEGSQIRITFPELTTERRKFMVKSLSKYTEQARIQIRQTRKEINQMIKVDEDLSEDNERFYLEEIQNLTNEFNKKIDIITKEKEKDIMTI
ncbi:MAG: ribosome recycling factor [Mycoplasma sp.]|nr:ribosome recycling factor [Mycoplasma sp.]